jgi:HlyD family secretion protein
MTSASGVVSTTGGPLEVGAGLDGAVTSVYVLVGTSVEAGNVLAVLIDQAGREVRVTTPVAGTVIEVATQEGDFIRSGQGIATIQRFDENLLALALVPASSISGIVVGDEALVAPDSFPAGQYGYLKGVVISVASTPMSVSRLEQLVMSVAGYPTIDTINEPLIEVQIELATDDTNPSGSFWTFGNGDGRARQG